VRGPAAGAASGLEPGVASIVAGWLVSGWLVAGWLVAAWLVAGRADEDGTLVARPGASDPDAEVAVPDAGLDGVGSASDDATGSAVEDGSGGGRETRDLPPVTV